MNKQEIFDKVADHLYDQNCQALSAPIEGGTLNACCYRGYNGTMCAVGCLIKDEYYDPSIEGRAADAEEVLPALQASLNNTPLDDEVVSLLLDLQAVHDNHGVFSDLPWREYLDKELTKVARTFKLVYKQPQE